jgi:hypothetical protein
MNPILRQPDVHYSQIASFLSFEDLVRCLRICRGLQEKIVLFPNEPRSVKQLVHPITERFNHNFDGSYRLSNLLVTARKVREKVGFHVSAVHSVLLVPEPLLRGAHIIRLTLSWDLQPIDLHYIQCTPRLQEISLSTLTPPAATALADNCPDLRKVSVIDTTACNESLGILARCPNLTDLSIHLSLKDGGSNLAQLRHLRSLDVLGLSPETLRNLPPTITDIALNAEKDDDLIPFFYQHPQLKRYKGNVSDAILSAIGPELETLHITHGGIVDDRALSSFVASHPSLTHLEIEYVRDAPVLNALKTGHLKLKTLDLPNNFTIPEVELRSLIIRFFPSLTCLRYHHDRQLVVVNAPPGQTLAQMWSQP